MKMMTFFANFLHFAAIRNQKKANNISAQQALLLQKDYIDNLSKNKAKLCSMPYLEIVKQLQSNKSEIFQAAVYYLVRIAKNENKQASDILKVLKSVKVGMHTQEDMLYLKAQIENLEQSLFSEN